MVKKIKGRFFIKKSKYKMAISTPFLRFNKTLFRKAFVLLLLIILHFNTGYSQVYTDEIATASANDFYISNKDRYYTNGNQFYYRHAIKQKGIDSTLEKKIFELESGQKIYNPFFAKAPDAATHNRPFTAYLYLGTSFNWFYKNEKIVKISAQVGTIGPNALGKEIQTSYHKLLNLFTPQGWEYQLKNEIGLNLAADYSRLLYRNPSKHLDITGLSSALLGNTFSGANVGMLLRLGQCNPLYQSVSFNSLIGNNNKPVAKEYFIFLRPQINYVAYNATIQGGMFRSDKGPVTFGVKPFVFVPDVGASFSSARWSVNFIITLTSNEVQSTATGYSYATWSVFYRFKQKVLKW
jgi:lipid A 3-O-deacylase